MDNIIELLVTIAFVALFSLPSLLKKWKEEKPKRPVFVPDTDAVEVEDEVYESRYEETRESDDFLQKMSQDIPKQKEYFTCETIEPEVKAASEKASKSTVSKVQQPENKDKEEGLLSFEEDEVIKGVVYSEILKRKF